MDPLYKSLYNTTEAGKPSNPDDIDRALASSDNYVLWIGCKAAGLSEDPQWIDRLQVLATQPFSSEPDINSIAVWALARIARDSADSLWQAMAASGSANARRAAADLIGEAKAERGLQTLSKLLRDHEPEVVNWAALSAAKLGTIALPILGDVIAETKDPRTFLYCADGLLKMGSLRSEELIRSALQSWPADQQSALGQAVAGLIKRNRT